MRIVRYGYNAFVATKFCRYECFHRNSYKNTSEDSILKLLEDDENYLVPVIVCANCKKFSNSKKRSKKCMKV